MRITLAGIRPRPDSIGPPGTHLRWAFPPQLGFPARGFSVYRRPSTGFKPDTCLDLSQATSFLPGSVVQGVRFVYPQSVQIQAVLSGLRIEPPGEQLLELQFSKPVAYVRLDVRGPRAALSLSAYAGHHLVATSPAHSLPADTVSLEVAAPFITRVSLPLQFTTLLQACYLGAETACRDPSWGRPFVRLPLPRTTDDALARLEKGLANRYAANRNAAVKRYGPELDQLLNWLWLLQDPDSQEFEIPGASPDELRLRPSEADHPLQSIQPQSVLLLAALDPNIARLLSLYWVDESGRRGQEATIAYDYKVEGHWPNQNVGCGLILGLGPEGSALPRGEKPLTGQQLPGLRFLGQEPLGRVGLRWPRPPDGQGAVHPVLFDLSRGSQSDSVLLTEETPVLVPATAWQQDTAALFIESDVSLGKHTYRLRPIDLFGQVGDEIMSDAIAVQDLEAPPPPVRVRALLTQPGYPWLKPEQRQLIGEPAMLLLQFEYGDAQHRQAPDAREFRLYWRETSLFESHTVTLTRVSSTGSPDGAGAWTHTVQVGAGSGVDLSAFEGGKLSRESGSLQALPAAERHHYQIAEVLGPDRLRLAPSDHDFQDGTYRLLSDPRLRSNWHPIQRDEPVRVDPPLVCPLVAAGPGFRARAVGVKTLTPQPDPLAMLPAGSGYSAPAEAVAFVEVDLDRSLLDPDHFAGGTLLVGGQTHPILYSTAGSANTPARIGLPAGTSIPPGASVELRSMDTFKATVEHAQRRSDTRVTLAVTPEQPHSLAGVALLARGSATLGGNRYSIEDARREQALLELDLQTSGKLGQDLGGWVGQEVDIKPLPTTTLTLTGSLPSGAGQIPGGEIAFDVPVGDASTAGEAVTYVGHVLSDLRVEGMQFDLRVRLSEAAEKALQAGQVTVRYTAPYRQVLEVHLPETVGTSSAGEALDLSMPDTELRQNVYVAISTVDARANEGALSSPAQVVAVRPPPTGAPDAPYPCGQAVDAPAGYATPPDRRGLATLCLTWGSGSLSATGGLRYEVARALDSGLVATHRRNWLLGKAALAAPVKAGPSRSGALQPVSFDAARGLHRVEFAADLGTTAPAEFRGGRLAQDGAHFQVTVVALKSTGVLELMLRPVEQGTPVAGSAVLDSPPDYDELRHDPDALRQLAEANPEAFGLVTGTPIALQQFTDEIPGIGRNSYFYRIRAVDGAENRSAWSAVSVPFHQVDTSPPEIPRQFGIVPGHRTAELVWLPPNEPGIVEYHVYRAEGDEPPEFRPATTTAYATLPVADVAPRPLRVVGRRLVLPEALADPDPTTIEVRPLSATSDAPNLFVHAADLTRLEDRRVRHLNPLVSDGTPVRVAVGDATTSRTLTHRPGSGEPLVVQDHIVDLTFGLDVTTIEVLLLAGQISDDADLETLLARPSLLQEDGITADVSTLTIGGLGNVLPDGIAVAVVVRLTDDSLQVLRHAPGTINALTVANGEVVLDLDIPDDSLQGVGAQSGVYAAGSPGREAPDLRVMQASEIVREGTDGPVTAVAHLNPLVPDGLALRVVLRTTAGDEHSLTGDPSQWSWIDTHLQGDHIYQYGLAARKRVVLAPAPTGGSPQERELISFVAGPVPIQTLALPVFYEEEEV